MTQYLARHSVQCVIKYITCTEYMLLNFVIFIKNIPGRETFTDGLKLRCPFVRQGCWVLILLSLRVFLCDDFSMKGGSMGLPFSRSVPEPGAHVNWFVNTTGSCVL